MMSRRSSNVEPMIKPPPAIVSRTGVTVFVLRWARLRALAIRAMADGRGWLPVEPGWKLYSLIPRASQRWRSSRKAV